jgi:hypothetical protein
MVLNVFNTKFLQYERFSKMAKKGRHQDTRQYLKSFQQMNTKDILGDEEKLEQYDDLESKYEDETMIERINSNMRKKLKNGNY